MAQIMGLLRDGSLRVGVHQRQSATCQPDQARDHPQKRGFARAIASADDESLSAADRKPKRRKHLAAAANASKAASFKPHRRPSRRPDMSATQSPASSYSRLSSRARKKPL